MYLNEYSTYSNGWAAAGVLNMSWFLSEALESPNIRLIPHMMISYTTKLRVH